MDQGELITQHFRQSRLTPVMCTDVIHIYIHVGIMSMIFQKLQIRSKRKYGITKISRGPVGTIPRGGWSVSDRKIHI